jgi:hypothetical protein
MRQEPGQVSHEHRDDSRGEPDAFTASELFDLLWQTLADVMGSAATATLLRRALKRAQPGTPSLDGLEIRRQDLNYRYEVPATWQQEGSHEGVTALRCLMDELLPLLVTLTGPVVIRRLERQVPLRDAGLLSG